MLSLIFILVGLCLVVYAFWPSQNTAQSQTKDEPKEQLPETQQTQFYGPIEIIYATQTGTAGRFARQLVQAGREQDIVCVAKCIDECSIEDLSQRETTAVFLVSTHYEGEPTDDMVPFWKSISKLKESTLLSKLGYTGFALGDQNYKYYNQTGRLLSKKLEELGGKILAPFGEGSNHAGRIEEYFEEWSIPLWNNLLPHLKSMTSEAAKSVWESSDPTSYTVLVDAPQEQNGSFSDVKYQPETEVHVC